MTSRNPPEQLPIASSSTPRPAKFLDFGAWAMSVALSFNIFLYVRRLITTQPKELRLLTFIWAKILAVEKSCQAELAKDKLASNFSSSSLSNMRNSHSTSALTSITSRATAVV